MQEDPVRASAAAVAEALVAGDVDAVIALLSDELKRNPGEVVAMLPLPATSADIVSVDRPAGAAATVVVLRIVGETSEVELQTRWKERDGEPRIIEVSHLSQKEREAPSERDETGEGDGGTAPSDAA